MSSSRAWARCGHVGLGPSRCLCGACLACRGDERWRQRGAVRGSVTPRPLWVVWLASGERMRPSRDRRGERTGQRGQQEAAAVNAGIVGRVATQVRCGTRLASSSSSTRCAMLAPQSQAIQTTSPSTPASRSPQRPCSVKKASRSVGQQSHGRERLARRRRPRGPARRLARRRPAYSMTWSARASRDGGIVRPRALAVLRLIASSNLVGCSTGMSAGFTPRRILSTKSAVRRYRSRKLGP
jgi:hypothetical protein